MIYGQMASPSRRGWRAWQSPAGSTSAARCATRCAIGCRSRSRISASTRSRTSPARSVSSASCWMEDRRTRRAPAAEEPPRHSTGRRSPCCRFRTSAATPKTEFFLDSVAEDLITELARARWFSIVARNTSFSYKGKGADSKQLARELGVRYVVEGSLRKAGSRVRISLPARRGGERPAPVGRPLRRHARRLVRSAGQDHRKRHRLGRPGAARGRDRAGAAQARGEPGRLRSHRCAPFLRPSPKRRKTTRRRCGCWPGAGDGSRLPDGQRPCRVVLPAAPSDGLAGRAAR